MRGRDLLRSLSLASGAILVTVGFGHFSSTFDQLSVPACRDATDARPEFMSRVAEKPKKHIVSFRVDESEWKILKRVSQKTGSDISTLLRKTLQSAFKADRSG